MSALLLWAAGCAGEHLPQRPPLGGLEARYRLRRAVGVALPGTAATQVYRSVSVGHGSACQMHPSDSRLFDLRAPACGGLVSAALGVAGLLEEIAASAATHAPVLVDGKLRWWDLPERFNPTQCR